jgi:hypothetical protein
MLALSAFTADNKAVAANLPTAAAVAAVAEQAQPAVEVAAVEVAGSPHALRLRKLHLVRPDLIPFPVLFEVYC